jgi:hypothetical protein
VSTSPRALQRTSRFADAHELLPSRFSHWFELVALLVILAGDAVAFQMIVAVAMPHSSTRVTWTLIIALSAAATITMHLAGVSARRRRGGVEEAGLLWRLFAICCWLFLGGTALYFRLLDAAASHHQASSSSIFGDIGATGSATAIPLALLMLGLYLVGGITAYGIGYGMHNPARTAYLRAHGELRRAQRAHRRATRRRHRALAKMASPLSGVLALRVHRWLTPAATPTVEATVAVGVAPQDVVTDASPVGTVDPKQIDDAGHVQRGEADTSPDELAVRRQLVLDRARAQADQLREHARHRLATALAEPARTSGVFDGRPRPSGRTPTRTTEGETS